MILRRSVVTVELRFAKAAGAYEALDKRRSLFSTSWFGTPSACPTSDSGAWAVPAADRSRILPVTRLPPSPHAGTVFSNAWYMLLPSQGPDFGYVTRGPQTGEVSDLDSFGNLEVSPPVKVGRKKYPLGRILIGSSCYPR